MEIDKELLEKIVCRESTILKAVLAKFGKQRVSELNEPEIKGLLAMYDRVSRNYTSEIINAQKDKRMDIIREERRQKAAPAPVAHKETQPPEAAAEPKAVEQKSEFPEKFLLKDNKGNILYKVEDLKVSNPAGVRVDELRKLSGAYGDFLGFKNRKGLIVTKSKNGSLLLKEKQDGKYKTIGHLSTNGI